METGIAGMVEWNDNTKYIAVDTEATGIGPEDYPFAVSLCDEFGNNILFEWDVEPHSRTPSISRKDAQTIVDLCKGKTLVFHNISYDISRLEMIDIHLDWRGKSYDTRILSHLIDSEIHSRLSGRLKDLALHYLDVPDDDQKDLREAVTGARRIAKKKYPNWNILEKKKSGDDHIVRNYWLPKALSRAEKYDPEHPWHNVCGVYANVDTERTMLLFLLFMSVVDSWEPEDKRHEILQRETALMPVIYDMEIRGMNIFPHRIEKTISQYMSRIQKSSWQMKRIIGKEFNVQSTLDLQSALFNNLRCPSVKQTENGNQSTDKTVREHLTEWAVHNASEKVNRFMKAWNTHAQSSTFYRYACQYRDFKHGNMIYCSLNQCGTSTTRMSSSKPNGQNIKKADEEKDIAGLRNLFGPRKGRSWVCFDYSQLQLRIFAYVTEEQSMIEAFEHGHDFHAFIASRIFNKQPHEVTKSERRIGKNVNFGFVFGAQPAKIEQTSGVSGLWSTVTSMFPSAHRYMESIKKQVYKHGYVTTPHGYRLYCDAAHKGVNYIVQGCEGDIVKEGMLNCHRYLESTDTDMHMIFQVHDELIFEAPLDPDRALLRKIKKLMERPGTVIDMNTPVDVEYTNTDWEHVKEIRIDGNAQDNQG